MWCRVLTALKFEDDGTRRLPGAVVDIPEEIFATLPEGTVELTDAPAPESDVPPAPPADVPEAPAPEPAGPEPDPAAAVEAVPEPPAPPVDTTAPVAEEPSAPVSTG